MTLTLMPKPMFIVGLTESRERMVWRCAEQGCARVAFDPMSDADRVPADVPAPSSPAERQREYRMVQSEMIFAGDR